MYDMGEHKELETFAMHMLTCCQFQVDDGTYDLVLEVQDGENSQRVFKTWCYYLVNHATKAIFWLENYDACAMIAEVMGITLESDKSYLSES
jgi:hypothetical protein